MVVGVIVVMLMAFTAGSAATVNNPELETFAQKHLTEQK